MQREIKRLEMNCSLCDYTMGNSYKWYWKAKPFSDTRNVVYEGRPKDQSYPLLACIWKTYIICSSVSRKWPQNKGVPNFPPDPLQYNTVVAYRVLAGFLRKETFLTDCVCVWVYSCAIACCQRNIRYNHKFNAGLLMQKRGPDFIWLPPGVERIAWVSDTCVANESAGGQPTVGAVDQWHWLIKQQQEESGFSRPPP